MTEDLSPAGALAGESSPYLQRQAAQPVRWHPWGDRALRVAAESNLPLLISIGSGTSHQCARGDELFNDEALSSAMNGGFVNIKADVLEHPELDAHLRELVRALGIGPDYPLIVFATPQGYPYAARPPIVGDTPDEVRAAVEDAARTWRDAPEETVRRAEETVEQLRRAAAAASRAEPLGPAVVQQGVLGVQAAFDDTNAGFGDSPRHSRSPVIEFMLRAGGRGIARAATVAEASLRKMAQGGIYDQIGGGFHHLSVDRAWQVPRFEKLLIDNALLARAYTHAWQLLKDDTFSRIALETLEYLQRDLSDPAGAFYAAESAFSQGEEGRYYTWSHDEFVAAAPDATMPFGVTRNGQFRGRNVLRLVGDERPPAAGAALLKQRRQRRRPDRDERIVTSWNGLAIAALAEAGAALDRPDLVEAARRTAMILLRNRRPSGALNHVDGVPGMLEDYAYLAEGLYTLWETTFEPEWIAACEELVRRIIDEYWEPETGGLFTTPASARDGLLPRRKEYLDGVGPSPAAVTSILAGRLAVLTGNQLYARMARQIVEDALPSIANRQLDSAAMLSAVDSLLERPVEIVVLGSTSDRRTRDLRKQIWVRYLPNKVAAGAPPLVPFPMLEGKEPVGDAPTVHVSRGGTRKPPVLDPENFETALKFWTTPSERQVSRVTALIGNALQRRHFFDNLQNPAWIAALNEAGLFRDPPEPIYDFAEGTVGSPPWPQSKYLARMAPFSPETVHEVAIGVPQAENVQVHEDLADVALALPSELAVQFIPRAREWLRSPYLLHLPEKLGALIVRLAEGGQVEAAIELAGAVLELRPGDPSMTKQPVWMAPEPRGMFARFTYETILKEQIPTLARKAAFPTLELLADLVATSIDLSYSPGEDRPPSDHSHLWRPAIHEHEQNVDKSIRDLLVQALADVAEDIAREQPQLVPELVQRLERRQRHIFRRVALHLLRVWPEVAPELISRRLMDRHLFSDPHFHHEYMLLARDHFEELAEEDRQILLSWVDQGPDVALWETDPRTLDLNPESADEYRDRWRLDRLALLHESLPEPARQSYEELVGRFGPPPHPDFVVHGVPGRTDPTTPLQADDLHEMPVADLVVHLKEFKPVPGLGNPTVEGLARKLDAVVATQPAKFAGDARLFKGVDPAYIWAVLHALREASEGFEFEWRPVLELARWAASQDMGTQSERWRPARMEISRLLSRGLGQGQVPGQLGQTQGEAQTPIPYRMRAQVWEAIRPLTEDPDPSGLPPTVAGVPQAPAVQSVNSVRGEAMNAVMRYALWVRREIESSGDRAQRLSRGFDEMPEVREVLETHLDPAQDSSPAIRSVYGRWFAYLLMLDGRWAAGNVGRIFPTDPAENHLRQAAWESHVGFSSPYDHLLSVIEGEYRRAVELVGRFEERPPNTVSPENRLAEHLMVFYLRGKVGLDRGGLVGRFFAEAPEELRLHALSFIGRSLKNQEGQVPRDVVMRIQALWERRMQAIASGDGLPARELAAFGWWFASGKLDNSWSVKQLISILERGVRIEQATMVISRLKELGSGFADRAVEALDRILASEQDSVNLVAWTDDAREILNQALHSGDDAARATALRLLDFFDVQELEELVRWDS